MAIESRPLTEQEKEKRDPIRTYPFTCSCGSALFHLDWAMYKEMEGGARIFCASCERECVPTEPMQYNA